ncbi:MAG: tRNA (adenosine(37)-N6)-threonylcarbamoyltransferase complex dimerization subunit type 1 TsaB [Candidatus Acidiferrales bacterium]
MEVQKYIDVRARLANRLPYNAVVLVLAVDTSSPSGSVAVVRDEKLLGAIHTSSEETYSSRLFRHLDFLLHDLSLELRQFDLFAVATGPGSFTGLRVGLATAKAWAEVHEKPVTGVSVLAAVAAQSRSTAGIVVPVLDARRGQFYFGVYRQEAHRWLSIGEDRVAAADELRAALSSLAREGTVAVVTTDAPASGSLFTDFGVGAPGVEMVSSILAPSIGRLGLAQAAFGGLSDSLSLDANYVRRSDAELHFKTP